MTLISRVTLDSIVLDGLEVTHGMPLSLYEQALGAPARSVMPGPPPPYGHRNNVIHFYDQLGIILREHHATRLIEGIDFQLEPSKAVFPAASPYRGELWVCGASVHAEMEFDEFADKCEQSFKPHLGHAWYLDGECISIQFEVYSPKEKGQKRKDLITDVAVGFRGAHLAPL
jgi:hypothetical protein